MQHILVTEARIEQKFADWIIGDPADPGLDSIGIREVADLAVNGAECSE